MTEIAGQGRILLAHHPDFEIRPMRLADRPAMETIAAQVWEGHDYLPRVFDEWLADEEGLFCAAALGAELIGLGKLTRMDDAVLWMEGLRVDPAYRGQGVGRILHHYIVNYARRFAPGVLRFSTASENTSITKFATETGFTQIASFVPYGAAAEASSLGGLRVLGTGEFALARNFVEGSDYFKGTGRTFEESWRFPPLTEQVMRLKLAQSMVYGLFEGNEVLTGIAVLNEPRDAKEDDEEGGRFYVGYLDAAAGHLVPMARALRALAHQQGFPRVSLKVLNEPRILDALREAGYELRWEMHVLLFERALSLTEPLGDETDQETSYGNRTGNSNRNDF